MANALEHSEAISALADGELGESVFAETMGRVAQSDQSLACWHTYHLIGDVLRSSDASTRCDGAAFLDRLRGALADEVPMGQRVGAAHVASELIAAYPGEIRANRENRSEFGTEAANAPVFAWKLVAGLASFAAVAAIGWSAVQSFGPGTSGAVIADAGPAVQASAQAANPGAQQVVLRDARLDELLRAHKQAGGSSVLQTPSGFLRNATYDVPPR